jgi:predicted nucleic acid-binding protein
MDLADATLVALGEALGVSKVFTLDHKDFSTYRWKLKRRFKLLPPAIP